MQRLADLEKKLGVVERNGWGQKYVCGSDTIHFSSSTDSDTATIEHELCVVPTVVVATGYSAPSFNTIPRLNTFSYTATTFGMNGRINEAYNGTIIIVWVAFA